MNVPVTVAVSAVSIPASVSESSVSVPASPSLVVEIGGVPYSGSYDFTPTDEVQTIACEDRLMMQDITIQPIPSNYGKVSWDGAAITIE